MFMTFSDFLKKFSVMVEFGSKFRSELIIRIPHIINTDPASYNSDPGGSGPATLRTICHGTRKWVVPATLRTICHGTRKWLVPATLRTICHGNRKWVGHYKIPNALLPHLPGKS